VGVGGADASDRRSVIRHPRHSDVGPLSPIYFLSVLAPVTLVPGRIMHAVVFGQ
jgi:uncharacterized membrane protein